MTIKKTIILFFITTLILSCEYYQKISSQDIIEHTCSTKIKGKYKNIKGVVTIQSTESTDGLKLNMGKYSDIAETVITTTFITNTNEEQSCTCLFDDQNEFLSLLEDSYIEN